MKRKNNLFLYFKKYLIGFVYVFLLLLIIVSGNERSNIVTTNINTVKSIKSSSIISTQNASEKFFKVSSTEAIKEYGSKQKIEFTGTLTGYGPDCVGCSGIVACAPNPNAKYNNIYFNDKEYGKIRILAADRSIPCGSIIKISNYKFIDGDFYGIVLDRGGAIVGLTMDLLYPSENDTVIIGRTYNINFKIVRWGW